MGRFEAMFRRMHEVLKKPVNGYDLMTMLLVTRVLDGFNRQRTQNATKATSGRSDQS